MTKKKETKPAEVASDATKPDPLVVLEKVQKESPELILRKQLQAPFPASDIRWHRPGDTDTLLRPSVHPAAIMDRLDEVFGVDDWRADYSVTPVGSDDVAAVVTCRIVYTTGSGGSAAHSGLGDDWIAALILAAQHMGIGRYLGRVAFCRVGETPTLPAWAVGNAPEHDSPYHGCKRTGIKVASDATLPAATKLTQPPPEGKKAEPPEKDEPKKTPPVKDQVARTGKTDYELRRDYYADKLGGCRFPDELTELLKELAKEKPEHKKDLWDLVRNGGISAGWKWNAEDKVFYKPLSEGETIPF